MCLLSDSAYGPVAGPLVRRQRIRVSGVIRVINRRVAVALTAGLATHNGDQDGLRRDASGGSPPVPPHSFPHSSRPLLALSVFFDAMLGPWRSARLGW
jgi:hypothetical protein